MTRRLLQTLALGAGILSCSSTTSRPPATRPSAGPADSVGILPAERTRVLAPGTQSYQALLSTISEDRTVGSPRRDSSLTTPRLLILLRRVAGGGFLLQLQSEPWRPPVSDTVFTPVGTPAPSGTAPLPVQLAVDSLGMHATFLTQKGAGCSVPGTETFSPLATRLLILPGLLHTSGANTLKDSLSYRICSSGTPLQTMIELEYTRDTARRESASGAVPVTVHLRGSIRGDSTRALPMRLQGTLTGRAAIIPDTGTTALARAVTADFVLDLTAESSLKRQEFRQTVHVRMSPAAVDSLKR